MKKVVVLLVLTFSLSSLQSYAGSAINAEQAVPLPQSEIIVDSRHSFVLDGGIFLPAAKNIAGVGKINDGYYTDLKYVFKPNDMFSFASTVGLYGFNADSSSGQKDIYAALVVPIKETVLLTIPILDAFEIYGGVGVGYYIASATVNANTGTTYNNTDSSFGYHITAGAEYKLTNRFSLQADAIWENAKVNLMDINNNKIGVDIGGTSISGGVKIKF